MTSKHYNNIMPNKGKNTRGVARGAGITNRLRERRMASGNSQGDLAAMVGITRQALYAIEMNHYLPGTKVALRLASNLG